MAPVYVQSKNDAASASITFNSAVTAGNTLIYIVRIGANATGFSVSDTINGSTGWTAQTVYETLDGHTLAMAYRANTAAGTPTVTGTWTGGGSTRTAIAEYGGVDAASFDQWGIVDRGNQPTIVISPSVTTTAANEVLIAAATAGGNPTPADNAAGANPSTGWTIRENVGGGKLWFSDVTVSATGTYQAAWSFPPGDNTASGIISLKSTAAAAAGATTAEALPWRRGQAKPFNSIPRINWRHPLAQGLAFYVYDAAGCFVDLVNGGIGRLTLSGGTPSKVGSSPFGGGLNFNSPASYNADCLSMPPAQGAMPIGTALPYTLACATVYTGTQGAAGGGAGLHQPSGSNVQGVAFCPAATSATKMTLHWSSGVYNDMSTVFALNAFQSWAVVPTSATTATAYSNGVVDASGTLVGLGATTNTLVTPQIVFNNNDASGGGGTGGLTGFWCYFAGWNRSLTATEIAALHFDPYCFLRFAEDDIFNVAPPAGAAGPVTAIGSAAGVGAANGDSTGTVISIDPGHPVIQPMLQPGLGPASRRVALFNFDLPAVALTVAAGAAAGTGAASAVGTGIFTATGSSTSTATVAAQAAGQGASAGTGAATATAAATTIGVGSAAGTTSVTGQASVTGAAAGTGAATATGVALSIAAGASAGTGAATGKSQSIGAAAGLGAGIGTGSSIASSVGSAAGTGAAAGQVGAASIGAASGTGAATATGLAADVSQGSSAGTGAATAIGASLFAGVGNAAGTGAGNGRAAGQGNAAGLGAAAATSLVTAVSVGNAAGTGNVQALSGSASFAQASGIGAAQAVGTGINTATGAASGTGAATATSTVAIAAVGNAAGTGALSAKAMSIGASAGLGAASAGGLQTISAVGNAAGIGGAQAFTSAFGTAAGTGAASAVGRSTSLASGASAGTGALTATGQSFGIGVGASSGTGALTAKSLAYATGSAAGTSTVLGTGRVTIAAVGSSISTSSVNGASAVKISVAGSATGVGALNAISTAITISSGSSAGVGAAHAIANVVDLTKTYALTGREPPTPDLEGRRSSVTMVGQRSANPNLRGQL